jgi:hypothetical protein
MAALEDLMKAMEANTAELQRNTAAMEKLVSLRTEAIDHVKQVAAPAEKPAAAAKAEKPAAAAKAEKPAAEPKTEAAPAKAPADPVQNDVTEADIAAAIEATEIPTPDFMKKVVAAYVGWGGTAEAPVSTDEREVRKGKVKDILANPKVNAKSVADISEGARRAVLKKLQAWIAEIQPAASSDEVDDL